MSESGKNLSQRIGGKGNAAKKAYEIAYALFRVSAKISEPSVKDALESRAIELLISANTEAFDCAAKEIAAIEALVKFAIDLNIINISNGDVLLREIASLNEMVIERLDKSDDIDVSKFFSKNKDSVMKDVVSTFPPTAIPNTSVMVRGGGPSVLSRSVIPAPRSAEVLREGEQVEIQDSSSVVTPTSSFIQTKSVPAQAGSGGAMFYEGGKKEGSADRPASGTMTENSETSHPSNPAIALKSGNRQIAILDRIRQSGNCKLRDIQEILPDCSERTIRYDLEELIERNLVERIGAGGPAVSYRIRQSSVVPAQSPVVSALRERSGQAPAGTQD